MSVDVQVGESFKTKFGNCFTILGKIDHRKSLYIVECEGTKKILKWYNGNRNQESYYSISTMIAKGAPCLEIMWPVDITQRYLGEFGVVYNLLPDDYSKLSDIFTGKIHIKSIKNTVDAALHIVSGLRKLHEVGYVYWNVNPDVIYINPQNGNVLIGDTENIGIEGVCIRNSCCHPKYMAPEIVLNENIPDHYSDRFSMSVVLYMMLCMGHPLEGKKALVTALTPTLQEKLYGSEAMFVMDPNDHSNEPHPIAHKTSAYIWSRLPMYLQDIFIQSFSQEAIKNPTKRPNEQCWQKVLARFRSSITECECGNQLFLTEDLTYKCDRCGKRLSFSYGIDFDEYTMPICKGSRIYQCQLGFCKATEALNPVATIVEKKDGNSILGIKNKSLSTWNVLMPDGMKRVIAPNEIIRLEDGITIQINEYKPIICRCYRAKI